jgi:hypothetical protein
MNETGVANYIDNPISPIIGIPVRTPIDHPIGVRPFIRPLNDSGSVYSGPMPPITGVANR